MRILPVLLTVLLFSACDTQSQTTILKIQGFDWAAKKVVELQPDLNEISGIVYDKAQKVFLSVNDEQGVLYVLDEQNFRIKLALTFGKKGDYECVTTGAEKVFVLKSNGNIFSMTYNGDTLIQNETFKFSESAVEFESCIWNQQQSQLQLISKKAAADKEIQANNIYDLDIASGQYKLDQQKISWKSIRESGTDVKAFHPSAAAIQESTGNIFVLSSIEKLLVVFNAEWKIISVHHLDGNLFKQPEGITFDGSGNLIITNEAAGASPTLIFIPIKK